MASKAIVKCRTDCSARKPWFRAAASRLAVILTMEVDGSSFSSVGRWLFRVLDTEVRLRELLAFAGAHSPIDKKRVLQFVTLAAMIPLLGGLVSAFSDQITGGVFSRMAVAFLLGVFLGEAGFIAGLGVCGPGRRAYRVAACVCLAGLLWVTSCRILEESWLEIGEDLVVLPLMLMSMQIPIWILCVLRGIRFDGEPKQQRKRQFSIADILFLTGLIAVSVGLVAQSSPTAFLEWTGLLIVLAGYSLLVVLPDLVFLARETSFVGWLVARVLLGIVLPLVVFAIVVMGIRASPPPHTVVMHVIQFVVCLNAGSCAFLFLVRGLVGWWGYLPPPRQVGAR